MIINIGIFAYNEAKSIPTTLTSLADQSLFSKSPDELKIKIIVIANGCSDNTVEVARNTLDSLPVSAATNIDCCVCELERAGKSNAWNTFVHQLSDPQADYLFFMDADIQLIESQTFISMVDVLETKPETHVAVDKPMKDLLLKNHKTIVERLSALVSQLTGNKTQENSAAWICGQLYCVRAQIIRRLWLPNNILNEDGFLYSAIVTDIWRSPANPERVILASRAAHTFEAYTDLVSLLRHEKAQICGNAVNELIYEDLIHNLDDGEDIGQLIAERNQQNYFWVKDLIDAKTTEKGWWLIPKFILIRRFLGLKNRSFDRLILLVPMASLAFLVDLLLSFTANIDLHRGKGLRYWG